MTTQTPSYRDAPGLTSRAYSALFRIELILGRTELPSEVRLALIARVMEDEPILTDSSGAASAARRRADKVGEYRR